MERTERPPHVEEGRARSSAVPYGEGGTVDRESAPSEEFRDAVAERIDEDSVDYEVEVDMCAALPTIVHLANPWRDERGRFAEKGHGSFRSPGTLITGELTVADGRRMIDMMYGPRRMAAIEEAQAWREENPYAPSYKAPGGIQSALDYIDQHADTERISDVPDEFKEWWAVDHGDNRRLNRWAKELIGPNYGALYDTVEPDEKFMQAWNEVSTNPAMVQAVEVWGEMPTVRVVGERNMSGLMGQHVAGGIVLRDILTEYSPVSGPLALGEYNVDTSVTGVLRHETGHHIDAAASVVNHPAVTRFDAAFREWGSTGGKATTMEEYEQAKAKGADGLSLYGRTMRSEAFAETFAKVTHPDYDYDAEPPGPVKDMADAVLDILDPEMKP